MMGYVSTRGQAPPVSFAEAALSGMAPDGGLYVPAGYPRLTAGDFGAILQEGYVEAACRIILPFVAGGIPQQVVARLLRDSVSGFSSAQVAPLSHLEEHHDLLELYHGPTLAFKDVALQFLGRLLPYLLSEREETATIIAATSGDTGAAAIAAFAGMPRVHVVVLHPKGRVSDMQRRQMTTVEAANVKNIAIEGDFDDCQALVKAMFADEALRRAVGLTAVNSINWARIAAQVVYYVTASLKVRAATGQSPAFVVPTGNFGNIFAGYVARAMGAPVGRLVAATNSNDILFRFFATGQMARGRVAPSFSPSMDIQVASNFERLLFDLMGRKGEAVAQVMAHFAAGGSFKLDDAVMTRARTLFASGRCGDEDTLDTIKDVWENQGRIIDPHTAVGVFVARQFRQKYPETPVVTLATAHPAKFPETVEKAIGQKPARPEVLEGLSEKRERLEILPPDPARLKEAIRRMHEKG